MGDGKVKGEGALARRLEPLDDDAGDYVPDGLPEFIDGHMMIQEFRLNGINVGRDVDGHPPFPTNSHVC